MSLLGRLSSMLPSSVGKASLPNAAGDGRRAQAGGPDATHLLIFNDPVEPSRAYGLGWTLVVQSGSQQQWSMTLAAHGADLLAETPVAQAVAARILADRGVRVVGWSDGGADTTSLLSTYRGLLGTRHDQQPEDADSGPHPPDPGWRRGLWPGH